MTFFPSLKNNKQPGFVLLYAVLVVTVVLAVGLILINIITKQITLSIVGRNSQVAFYAADSGRDCLEYWKRLGVFGDGSTGTYQPPDGSITEITCDGNNPVTLLPPEPNQFKQVFHIFWGDNHLGVPCARVSLQIGGTDETSGLVTSILKANGYNQSAVDDITCTSLISNRLTERVIEKKGYYTP